MSKTHLSEKVKPTDMIPSTPRSPCLRSYTPPDSPRLTPSSQVVTVELLGQVLVKLIQAAQKADTIDRSEDAKPGAAENTEIGESKTRASKMEYKTVNEIWDKETHSHKIEEAAATTDVHELDRYVFVLRKQFDKSNLNWKPFLDVKSESLRNVLREVLKIVPGLNLHEDMPTVDPALLFHHIAELEAHSKKLINLPPNDSLTIEQTRLLLRFLDSHFASVTRRLYPLLEYGEITFDLLWALFKPNDLLFTTCSGSGQPRCVRLISAQEKSSLLEGKSFGMDCRYLNHDGKSFGEATVNLNIVKFHGVQKIRNLDVFPLRFHGEEETIRDELVRCGRKLLSLQGVRHQYYRGKAFYMRKNNPVKFHVQTRVMVDAISFQEANPNYRTTKVQQSRETLYGLGCFWDDLSSEPRAVSQPAPVRQVLAKDMRPEDLLICSPTVLGYSLEDKMWLEFAVAELMDIEWDSTPFERLELAKEKKLIIQALAESVQSGQDHTFDDFVSGKGRGIISLLHGPPGVGKTLTAEGISEHLQRPLYSVSAGELGRDPDKLEEILNSILHLASHWKAILLLDEADVFLEQRSSGMLSNNALVSVFLRKLEYFRGIMFLTTNRIKTFDEAIISRVHFPLRFDHLDAQARKNIWVGFLEKTRTSHGVTTINEKQIGTLTEKKLNGRQIKNAVRTGLALAKKEGSPLAISHLLVAIKASVDFEADFRGHGAVESLTHYG